MVAWLAWLALLALILIAWRQNRGSSSHDPGTPPRIERIRAYRERHGVTLKEAKCAIDAQDRGQAPPLPSPSLHLPPSAEVVELARAGQLIAAIKLHREQTGASLKDAKEAVEQSAK
jgi:DNA-binding transcriptional MerR regulator